MTRDEVRKVLKLIKSTVYLGNRKFLDALDCAVDLLTQPEQPERKRGKWVIYVISMFDGEGCKCSECGFEGVPYWDFCPNCGAKMEMNNDR